MQNFSFQSNCGKDNIMAKIYFEKKLMVLHDVFPQPPDQHLPRRLSLKKIMKCLILHKICEKGEIDY